MVEMAELIELRLILMRLAFMLNCYSGTSEC